MRDRRGSYVGFAGAQGVTVYEDSTYPNMVLLLHFNGAENGTTFTDTSLNPFSVGFTGTVTTTQLDKKFGAGSLAFKDVGNSYLFINDTVASTRANRFGFGLGDYTVEAWVYLQSYKPNGSYIFDTSPNNSGFNFYVDSSGRLDVDLQNNTRILNPAPKTNQAYTVATAAVLQTFGAADPYNADVVTALHLNGVNGSRTITDLAPAPKSFVCTGNARIATEQSRSGGAAAFFDGVAGSAITAPSTADFDLPGDFVIEFWVRPTAAPAYNTPALGLHWAVLVSRYKNDTATNKGFEIRIGSGVWSTSAYNNIWFYTGVSDLYFSGAALPLNEWSHIAIVRFGTTITAYVNGSRYGNAVVNADVLTPSASRALAIGQSTADAYTATFNGFIDDFRITKGTARGFNSAATLIGQTRTDLVISTTNHNFNLNDSVYLQFPSFPSATGIYTVNGINSANQFSVLSPGTVGTSGTVNTTPMPPLTGTYVQSGTTITVTCNNHGLSVNDSVAFAPITGTTIANTYGVASVPDTNTFTLTAFTATTANGIAGCVPALTRYRWNHVALVRRNGVITTYLNGIRVEQSAVMANYNAAATTTVAIGTSVANTSNAFFGNIDELVVANVARYSSNFTPATTQYSELFAPISGYWSQREAEQYQRLGLWVGELDPRGNSNLTLWLDAADPNSLWDSTNATSNTGAIITSDTAAIGRWQDRSGASVNRNFVRPGATSGLRRVSNGKNGLPVVRFGATTNEYFNGPAWNTLASANGYTILVVARVNTASLGSAITWSNATLLSASFQNQFNFNATQAINYVHTSGATVPYTSNTWAVFTLTFNAATTTARILLNNNTATAGVLIGFNQNSSNPVSIGWNNYNGNYLTADIAEILFFNAELSAAAQTGFYNYLSTKWAIT